MATYLLSKYSDYARLVEINFGVIIRTTESKLLGIIPKDGDIIIVDAHYGETMHKMDGLRIVRNLKRLFSNKDIFIIVLSWYPIDCMEKKAGQRDGITYKQLPFKI